jgi:hypothetical protein
MPGRFNPLVLPVSETIPAAADLHRVYANRRRSMPSETAGQRGRLSSLKCFFQQRLLMQASCERTTCQDRLLQVRPERLMMRGVDASRLTSRRCRSDPAIGLKDAATERMYEA